MRINGDVFVGGDVEGAPYYTEAVAAENAATIFPGLRDPGGEADHHAC